MAQLTKADYKWLGYQKSVKAVRRHWEKLIQCFGLGQLVTTAQVLEVLGVGQSVIPLLMRHRVLLKTGKRGKFRLAMFFVPHDREEWEKVTSLDEWRAPAAGPN